MHSRSKTALELCILLTAFFVQKEAPSLWHEMQQRQEGAEDNPPEDASHSGLPPSGRIHRDLFDEGSFSSSLTVSHAAAGASAAASPLQQLPPPRPVLQPPAAPGDLVQQT